VRRATLWLLLGVLAAVAVVEAEGERPWRLGSGHLLQTHTL